MGVRCFRGKADREPQEIKQVAETAICCDDGVREVKEPGTLQEGGRKSTEMTQTIGKIGETERERWSRENRLGCSLEGVRNEGNTCFAGAASMALLASSTFVEALKGQKEGESSAVSRALLALETDKSQVAGFLSYFQEFNDGLQHCAHDFLTHIFMQLGGKSNLKPGSLRDTELLKYCRSNRNSDVFDIYAVVTQTKLSCVSCVLEGIGEPMVKGTMMWSTSVPMRRTAGGERRSWCAASKCVTDKAAYWQLLKQLYESKDSDSCTEDFSLLSSLQLVLGVSLLPPSCPYFCPKCQVDTQHFRQQEIVHAGSQLILHLQRYDPASHNKDFSLLKIPISLDLSQFNESLGKYALYAVICHTGWLGGGHYWVNLRSRGRWHKYDDHEHTFISEKQALDETAYVLFYRQIARKPRN